MPDRAATKKRANFSGAIRGVLADLNPDGEPMVDFVHNPSGKPVLASSTVAVELGDIGKEAVIVLEDGDPARPIVLGMIRPARSANQDSDRTNHEIQLNCKKFGISADQEIILECGGASITLTRAGKVLIRGKYLLSRSSGVNRIKGGSVQIN
jgi:hypothetical protein